MGTKLTNDEFLKRLKDKDIQHIPLDEYKKWDEKIRWKCFKNNEHVFEATPGNIICRHSGCPYCRGLKPFIGETDLWTTHPQIARMLKNSEEGYLYSYGSQYVTDWICPDCGSGVNGKSIKLVVGNGLSCDNCSKNISYPEKTLISFFNQLGVEYIHDKSTAWSNKKRYDFYIPDLSIIVECHGEQHYNDIGWCDKSSEAQKKNDEYKMNIAMSNGVEHYIQLNCSLSEFDYIKKSIINSDLANIFDLCDFDWSLCEKNICMIKNNYYNDILQLTSEGVVRPSEISRILGIGVNTAQRYLKKLSSSGLSEYDSNTSFNNYIKRVSKPVICVETGEKFPSICAAARHVDGNDSAISRCCRGIWDHYKGYHWSFL